MRRFHVFFKDGTWTETTAKGWLELIVRLEAEGQRIRKIHELSDVPNDRRA